MRKIEIWNFFYAIEVDSKVQRGGEKHINKKETGWSERGGGDQKSRYVYQLRPMQAEKSKSDGEDDEREIEGDGSGRRKRKA